MTPNGVTHKKMKRFCLYSKGINGTKNDIAFTLKLATIKEEDAIDLYYEILCNEDAATEDEAGYPEISFQACLAIGVELLR